VNFHEIWKLIDYRTEKSCLNFGRRGLGLAHLLLAGNDTGGDMRSIECPLTVRPLKYISDTKRQVTTEAAVPQPGLPIFPNVLAF